MSSVFISYRREDSAGHAGRLCDRLSSRLGGDRVFMDVEDVKPGQNFVRSIDDTIAGCACVIAVIGPRWLEIVQQRGESGDDFVRHEISAALARGIMVIPVLVGGARMPAEGQLPPELSQLSRHQAIEIRDNQFDADVTRLIEFLGSQRSITDGGRRYPFLASAGPLWLTGAIVLVVTAIVAFLAFRAGPDASSVPDVTNIDGDWIAEMQNPAQPSYRIRLTFYRIGETVTGSVRYPTGEGSIQDGKLTGRTLTFYTSHVPQFEDVPAIIRFVAEVMPDGIRLIATSDTGATPGFATRASP